MCDNSILINQLNEEIKNFRMNCESKKFYEENKKDIYMAMYENYNRKETLNTSMKKYHKTHKEKYNEYQKQLRHKKKEEQNFYCSACNQSYSDTSHYKIHIKSKKHEKNMALI